MARVQLTFDSLSTPEARYLTIAHRFATGPYMPGKPNADVIRDGVGPRMTVEGPECWGMVTDKLTIDQFHRFQWHAGDSDAAGYIFPPRDALDEQYEADAEAPTIAYGTKVRSHSKERIHGTVIRRPEWLHELPAGEVWVCWDDPDTPYDFNVHAEMAADVTVEP